MREQQTSQHFLAQWNIRVAQAQRHHAKLRYVYTETACSLQTRLVLPEACSARTCCLRRICVREKEGRWPLLRIHRSTIERDHAWQPDHTLLKAMQTISAPLSQGACPVLPQSLEAGAGCAPGGGPLWSVTGASSTLVQRPLLVSTTSGGTQS
jgi:hypothetical protein